MMFPAASPSSFLILQADRYPHFNMNTLPDPSLPDCLCFPKSSSTEPPPSDPLFHDVVKSISPTQPTHFRNPQMNPIPPLICSSWSFDKTFTSLVPVLFCSKTPFQTLPPSPPKRGHLSGPFSPPNFLPSLSFLFPLRRRTSSNSLRVEVSLPSYWTLQYPFEPLDFLFSTKRETFLKSLWRCSPPKDPSPLPPLETTLPPLFRDFSNFTL